MQLTITARVVGALRKDEEAGVFESFCPAPQVYSQGTTEQEAKAALESAVALFLSDCFQRGILDRTLKSRGFSQVLTSGIAQPLILPEEFATMRKTFPEAFEVEVALHLIASRGSTLAIHHTRNDA